MTPTHIQRAVRNQVEHHDAERLDADYELEYRGGCTAGTGG